MQQLATTTEIDCILVDSIACRIIWSVCVRASFFQLHILSLTCSLSLPFRLTQRSSPPSLSLSLCVHVCRVYVLLYWTQAHRHHEIHFSKCNVAVCTIKSEHVIVLCVPLCVFHSLQRCHVCVDWRACVCVHECDCIMRVFLSLADFIWGALEFRMGFHFYQNGATYNIYSIHVYIDFLYAHT